MQTVFLVVILKQTLSVWTTRELAESAVFYYKSMFPHQQFVIEPWQVNVTSQPIA